MSNRILGAFAMGGLQQFQQAQAGKAAALQQADLLEQIGPVGAQFAARIRQNPFGAFQAAQQGAGFDQLSILVRNAEAVRLEREKQAGVRAAATQAATVRAREAQRAADPNVPLQDVIQSRLAEGLPVNLDALKAVRAGGAAGFDPDDVISDFPAERIPAGAFADIREARSISDVGEAIERAGGLIPKERAQTTLAISGEITELNNVFVEARRTGNQQLQNAALERGEDLTDQLDLAEFGEAGLSVTTETAEGAITRIEQGNAQFGDAIRLRQLAKSFDEASAVADDIEILSERLLITLGRSAQEAGIPGALREFLRNAPQAVVRTFISDNEDVSNLVNAVLTDLSLNATRGADIDTAKNREVLATLRSSDANVRGSFKFLEAALIYTIARLRDPGGRLSDKDVEEARKSVSTKGAFNPEQFAGAMQEAIAIGRNRVEKRRAAFRRAQARVGPTRFERAFGMTRAPEGSPTPFVPFNPQPFIEPQRPAPVAAPAAAPTIEQRNAAFVQQ